jgi:UPF0271 protein
VIDLSADMGEGAAAEGEIWPMIDSANIACGGHYGDTNTMTDAIRLARENGVRVGAHPSYPDREHFGRESMTMPPLALRASIAQQIMSLRDIEGAQLGFVKPHGALYNDAHRDPILAGLIVDAIREVDPDLAIVCADSSQMAIVARTAGTRVIREAFGDRRYNADRSLVSRKEEGALLNIVEAAEQAKLLAKTGEVIARDGSRIAIPFDTICIHSDMENAVARLRAILGSGLHLGPRRHKP